MKNPRIFHGTLITFAAILFTLTGISTSYCSCSYYGKRDPRIWWWQLSVIFKFIPVKQKKVARARSRNNWAEEQENINERAIIFAYRKHLSSDWYALLYFERCHYHRICVWSCCKSLLRQRDDRNGARGYCAHCALQLHRLGRVWSKFYNSDGVSFDPVSSSNFAISK